MFAVKQSLRNNVRSSVRFYCKPSSLETATSTKPLECRNFINGEWVASSTSEWIDVHNP
eukprot:Pgem_evm1s13869